MRYEGETETIYGNQGAGRNDQTAAETSIDFPFKYTTQLKIQLIKRQLQIAAADLETLPRLADPGLPAAVRELHDFISEASPQSLLRKVRLQITLFFCLFHIVTILKWSRNGHRHTS